MMKIFLVAPTNNDCDVFEDRLQRGITVFDEAEVVWMNVLPVYWWLGSEEDTTIRAHVPDTYADMLTATCDVDSSETV